MIWTWCSLAVLSSLASPGLVSPAPLAPDAHIKALLVSEYDTIQPGKTAWLGLELQITPGWHTYWKGRNTTGTPPQVKFDLPPGYKAGEIQWPAPIRYEAYEGSLDHIYENNVLLLIPLEVPKDARPGAKIDLAANCTFVVCDEVCLMEKAKVTLPLTVADPKSEPKPTTSAPQFAAARKTFATPLKDHPDVRTKVDRDLFTIEAPGAASLAFFPYDDSVPTPELLKEGEAKRGKLMITLGPATPPAPQRVRGVLEVRSKDSKDPRYIAIDLEVPR